MIHGLLAITSQVEAPSDILIFFGRLHPIVVHLPIGFLLLAVLAQFAVRKPKFAALASYISYLWGLGAISAFLAVLFGYFLSLSGDYDTDTLFWHKWMGVAVLLLAIACFYTTKKGKRPLFFSKGFFTVLVAISITITGHLGGNLTHGSTYLLEYAPNPIRSLAGLPPKAEKRRKVTEIDSADVFLDMVLPMMQNKCVSCHNDEKKKGGLKLISFKAMMKGGENGAAVTPNNIAESELFRRITLSKDHDDFMPSEGKRPLTDDEVNLIEWWINNGAPSNGYFTQMNPDTKIMATATSFLSLDKENQFFSQQVAPPNTHVLDSLAKQGFVINHLMNNNNFLDANFSLSEISFQAKSLDFLTKLQEQLIWLNLNNSKIQNQHLKKIGQLQNLIKLDLGQNKSISDKGIEQLSQLSHLEYLNLYGTNVSDAVFVALSKLKSLKKVYLWQTQVTQKAVLQFNKSHPKVIVILEREQTLAL